jgi:hypothetical protein
MKFAASTGQRVCSNRERPDDRPGERGAKRHGLEMWPPDLDELEAENERLTAALATERERRRELERSQTESDDGLLAWLPGWK